MRQVALPDGRRVPSPGQGADVGTGGLSAPLGAGGPSPPESIFGQDDEDREDRGALRSGGFSRCGRA